jgi:hypothetical protein
VAEEIQLLDAKHTILSNNHQAMVLQLLQEEVEVL